MQPSEYQAKARTTALPNAKGLDYLIPGLGGELGEIQEVALAPYSNTFVNDIKSECADVLWFVALICDYFTWDFSSIVLEDNFEDLDSVEDLIQHSLSAERVTLETLIYELGVSIGEAQTLYAKAVRDDEGIFYEERLRKLRLSLSNIVFSIARIAGYFHVGIGHLMESNIKKLFDRKDRGKLGGSGNNR